VKFVVDGISFKKTLIRSIQEGAGSEVNWVKAAVAFAQGSPQLFNLCFEKRIPLTFYGRHDGASAVSPIILRRFLEEKSTSFRAKLVANDAQGRGFHPKVVWWGGYGAYIGSANLTDSAWNGNVECGVFLTEAELIAQGLIGELEEFFEELEGISIEVNDEIVQQIESNIERQRLLLKQLRDLQAEFEKNNIVEPRKALARKEERPANERRKSAFVTEWNSTLGLLRKIAERVAADHRPSWVLQETPTGVQLDQFLHAYYYTQVRSPQGGATIPYRDYYQENRKNPERALQSALRWWEKTDGSDFLSETKIMVDSPKIRNLLTESALLKFTIDDIENVITRVFAMADHSKRIGNQEFGLVADSKHDSALRRSYLAEYLWHQRNAGGQTIAEIIRYVLYGGSDPDIASRIWEAARGSLYIRHFGISSIGELVGWALPERFPPRNGRTSKALTALGFEVEIHSE